MTGNKGNTHGESTVRMPARKEMSSRATPQLYPALWLCYIPSRTILGESMKDSQRAARDVSPGTSWAFTDEEQAEYAARMAKLALLDEDPPDPFPPAGALRPRLYVFIYEGSSS